MPKFRVWMGLIALVVISLGGHWVVRGAVSSVDQDSLLQAAGEAAAQLPTSFGNWRVESSEPLSEKTLATLSCTAHQSRVYVNDDTGERVSMVLLVGRAGPLVAHTPEVCMSSVNYRIVASGRPEFVSSDGGRNTFARVELRSNSDSSDSQRVYYAWRPPKGNWQAPENPRMKLGGSPMLYKLQLATSDVAVAAEKSGEPGQDDAGRKFLADLLPVLDPILESR